MAKGKTFPIQRIPRPGEGAKLVVTEQKHTVDGETTLKLDMLQAQVPDRRYVADCGTVLRSGDVFRLVFAQSKTSPTGLRSVIDVQMMRPAVSMFLSSLETVQENLTQGQAQPLALLGSYEEPSQAVGLAANVVPIAFSGSEACMDFYQMSAFMMSTLAKGADVYAEPVVRVTLPTGLLIALIAKLTTLASQQS
jgi:hypothetical protein